MDLLDNIATELGFEFHLYIVRDQLFGSKQRNFDDLIPNKHQTDKADSDSGGYKSSSMDQKHRQYSGGSRGDSNTGRKYLLQLLRMNFFSFLILNHNNLKMFSVELVFTQRQKLGLVFVACVSFDFNFTFLLVYSDEHWNGIIGDLVSGSADMSFAPLSVSK